MPSTTTARLLELAAQYQQKADALRLAAAELNGHDTTRKQATAPATLEAAMALRAQQRGAKPRGRPRTAPAPSAPAPDDDSLTFTQRRQARIDAKARVYATILQARGPLTAAALSAVAREQGLPGITGINGYVKAGYLTITKVKGKPKGQDRIYGLKVMPPEPADG